MPFPLTSLVLSLFLCSLASSQCLPGEHYYAPDESCFSIHGDSSLWWEAEEECNRRSGGGNLVSIHDDVQNSYILQELFGLYDYWIGGEFKETSWQWSDGTPFDYRNWKGGEPKSGTYMKIGGTLGTWSALSDERLSFICSGPALNKSPPTPPSSCPAVTCPACPKPSTNGVCPICPTTAPCQLTCPPPVTCPKETTDASNSAGSYYTHVLLYGVLFNIVGLF